ncbi:MAG: nucleotide sugar dehydrogenase, partial [Candidatus Woesearchaeota archaeon]|nr:nucleotide sugar dehydrogenase [Candidatus Woesearchaeota archaeon]
MKEKVCLVGLGYVGLPLAAALSKHLEVIGFDISKKRIEDLKKNHDWSREMTEQELKEAKITYTNDPADIKKTNFIIIAVPTPVTKANIPDLEPVRSAGEIVGKNIQKGAIVVLESTVYPGVTEEYLAPIIEQNSGLKCGVDFKVGYSPERINPGDKEHSIEKVIKVVSGMDEETLENVAYVYSKACKAGVYKAANIKTAEAAKVIENTQRDLNIALMNELSIIFHKLGIRTKDVLDAAGTKWNFLKFVPGLVGGHCIGVDPYYLTYKAEELGYHPEVILA